MPKLSETVAALMARRPRPGGLAPAPSRRLRETPGFRPNPGDLRMLVYRPEDLAPGAPLVVVLHGCTQTAEAYAEGVGWLALADRYVFAVLCPEQSAANNPNRCFNWFQPEDTERGRGEAESIRRMVERALADHGLDPARVFVTGLSAGGAMSSVMLAAYPEVFAGGAIVAGIPYGAASNMQEAFGAMFQSPERAASVWGDRVRAASGGRGPWPKVSIWHGDGDATVRPGNADSIALQWADVHGLPTEPTENLSVNGHRRRVWSVDGEPVIESYTIRGMGHGVPLEAGGADGYGAAGPFLIEVGLSSSRLIAGFWGIADPTEASAYLPEVMDKLSAQPLQDETLQPRPSRLREGLRGGAFSGARPGAVDPGAVISGALRAAGLLK